jgi:hypothetical protein
MQMSVSAIIQAIRARLIQELHANIQDDWLSECVNYFVERDSNYNVNSLYESVKDQFLLANITDSSGSVISDSFFTKKRDFEWIMNNKMILQMQQILDICEFK